MKNNPGTKTRKSSGGYWRLALVASTALVGAASLSTLAAAEAVDRSGKAVVEATCITCHGTGKDGAPKIGDKKAWGQRASRGLTSLTQTALAGIRKMPAHGGSADASDLEISRAIAYMINQSGGHWVEPVGKPVPVVKAVAPPERSGQFIVQTQCGKCHLNGDSGAPRIGDRDAWVQRLKRGLDEVVRSAFNGHGPMPARGGLADITVNEMRAAITYMFNPSSATIAAPVKAPTAPPDPYHQIIGNTEIFFGIASVESIRAAQKSRGEAPMGGIPGGSGYYYINVALRDRITEVAVTNATVEARVEDPVMRGESKALDIMSVNKGISYGNFFRLPTKGRYVIGVKIERPDTPSMAEARFEFTRD